MTARTASLTEQQRRSVDVLRPFLGADADALYEANGRSLRKLAYFARDSSLPCCQQLVTGLALAQELLVEELTASSVFDSPTAVADFLKLHFAGQPYESFAVMYLDARNALLAFEDVFRGTLTQTSVYPREILKRALHFNCASVILSHYHPSDGVQASRADEVLTHTLRNALAMVDVRVLDHLIIAGGRSTSMAEHGLI
jgi:DNA repair protein RadC